MLILRLAELSRRSISDRDAPRALAVCVRKLHCAFSDVARIGLTEEEQGSAIRAALGRASCACMKDDVLCFFCIKNICTGIKALP